MLEPSAEPRQFEPGTEEPSDAGSRGAGIASKFHATDPDRAAAVTVVDGNQKAANLTEIRCGIGVEVTERNRDEDGSGSRV